MLRSIAKFFGLSDSELRDETSGGLVITLLLLPFRLLWGFIYFMIFSWTTSRSGRAFVFALPAMIAFVGYVGLVWAIGFKGDSKAVAVSRAYSKLYSNKLNPNYDPDAARLFATKVVEEAPEDPEYKYELGLTHELNEELDLALEIMDWIAPLVDVDSPEATKGFANAHLWLAAYYNNTEELDMSDEERKRISLQHLELASIAEPENVFAILGLAAFSREAVANLKEELDELEPGTPEAQQKAVELAAQRNDAINKLRHGIALELVTERQLYASIALVELLQEEEKFEQARIEGRQFINNNIRLAQKNPDVLPFWVSIVKICILIDDFDMGEAFILEAYQLAQTPEIRNTLAQLAAQIDVEKSTTFENMDDETQFLGRLNALAKAIKTDVKVPLGYKELLYFVDGFEPNSNQDFWLRDSVLGSGDDSSKLDPRLPGVLHVVIGFRDILNGDQSDGKNHWETAGQQFQLAAFAINYLIQVYSSERELTNEKKIELISIAVEMFPQKPNFYVTRGRFYVDDEKYTEALEDLEFAEARLPASIALNESILECHEKLGNEEKVTEYNTKIVELKNEAERDKISTGFSSGQMDVNSEDEEENN